MGVGAGCAEVVGAWGWSCLGVGVEGAGSLVVGGCVCAGERGGGGAGCGTRGHVSKL